MMAALALLLSCALDRSFGEPPARLHPVVWMGRYLGAFKGLCRLKPAPAFIGGLLAWALGAWVVVLNALLLQWGAEWLAARVGGLAGAFVGTVLVALMLKPLFAWALLRDEVAAVEAAQLQGLPAARRQLSRLVSRDTSQLQPHEVREAALETLAENLNDSVIAPLFWFAIGGLPAAALYRYANTADAMWGYRNEWEWAGKAAAHIDDALSWLPARITAALLLLGAPLAAWRRLPAEARRTPSPNGGWPMGALALALGVALRKPGVYALNDGARNVQPADTVLALRRFERAALVGAICLSALLLGVAWSR
jgi:adenosylcobinamide-phosphate synthase